MEIETKINHVERKKSAQGADYLLVDTAYGIMACWDDVLFDNILQLQGGMTTLLVDKKGKFTNIIGVGVGRATAVVESGAPQSPKSKNSTGTMYASYAKDLLVAGYKLQEAIMAVQALKAAFDK